MKPDKVHEINNIDSIDYKVIIKMNDGTVKKFTLSEFKWIHDAYDIFSKQSGFRGFK